MAKVTYLADPDKSYELGTMFGYFKFTGGKTVKRVPPIVALRLDKMLHPSGSKTKGQKMFKVDDLPIITPPGAQKGGQLELTLT